jgi:PAS domain S-box-containing protein
LQRLTLLLSLVTLAAVAAISAALLLLWRQQQRSHHLVLAAQSAKHDQLLRLFFDLPFVGMSITSPVNKRWIHVNDRLCDMLGYTRDEMLKLTWTELTYADDLAADLAEFERVLLGDIHTYQMDKRFVCKDGAIVETTMNVKAVRREDGSVEWVIATIQDITAQKHAEKIQLTLRNRIDEMLENMIDGFIALDKEWRFIYINRYAAHLLGHEPQDLLGKQIWQIFPGGVDQPFYHAYQRVMAQQIAERVENYFPPWQRWYENHIYPTQNGISVYFQDITERKAMEASLCESETKFRAMIEAEPECVKIIGPDGRLKFMNQAGLEMIEADSLEQVQGLSVLEIVTPDYQQAFRQLTKQILQGERGVLEFEIVGRKGTRRFLETHAVALRASEDEPFSLLGITRDITERKKMEDQLHQQLAELLRWQEVMLGREDRVQQLKSEVNNLLARLGQPLRYPSQAST